MQLLEPVELVVFHDLDLVFLVDHRLRNTGERKRQVLGILEEEEKEEEEE